MLPPPKVVGPSECVSCGHARSSHMTATDAALNGIRKPCNCTKEGKPWAVDDGWKGRCDCAGFVRRSISEMSENEFKELLIREMQSLHAEIALLRFSSSHESATVDTNKSNAVDINYELITSPRIPRLWRTLWKSL